MSVQEQVRKAQDVEGKLYTREDIGTILSTFAKTCYQAIRDEVGEDRAAIIAERIEEATVKEV